MNAKSNVPVYFRKLALENIRCFGKKQELKFITKEDKVAQWNLILGNNGTGKTTILKSIALACLNNHLHLREINFDYFVRTKEIIPEITFELGGSWKNTHLKIFNDLVIDNRLALFGIHCKGPKEHLKQMPLFGYGAARQISESSFSKEKNQFSAQSLFDEHAHLINAEEWLIQADYHALNNGNNGKGNDKEKVFKVLKRLLKGEIDDIKIDHANKTVKVLFKTKYGWVQLHQLSLGFRTLIAWMVDMASRMIDYYPDSSNPLKEPAIVLVDEIDLHLHPSFQRELLDFLTKTFLRTQFIVTAHSPLIVQAFEDANIFLLERKGNQVKVNQNPISIKNWRVDQILTSDLFGLESARSKKSEKLLTKRRNILAKSNLTEDDTVTLKRLESDMNQYPTGETQNEIEGLDLIKDFARQLAAKTAPEEFTSRLGIKNKDLRKIEFSSKIYGDKAVKKQLIHEQFGKCCFCESQVEVVGFGDVEHFRPKGAYKKVGAKSLTYPGYYWLAYDWYNLYFSCQICNGSFKKNEFPLQDENQRAKNHTENHLIALENPIIIHPSNDNPEDFISFREEVPYAIDDNERGVESISTYGLDRKPLNDYRLQFLDYFEAAYIMASVDINNQEEVDLALKMFKIPLSMLKIKVEKFKNIVQIAITPKGAYSSMIKANFPDLVNKI